MSEGGVWSPGPAWLFCPADRPERYEKALERSDVVILDLEDAVDPTSKEAAREAVRGLWLDPERTVLRINPVGTADHQKDLELAELFDLTYVMLAKAEEPADIFAIHHQVIALIETPRGVERAGAIAEVPGVAALMWGADDLIAGLGGFASRRPDGGYRDVARYARERVLIAAKAAELLALDAVYMDIEDLDGLAAECADAVAVGFDAKVAIHPAQVPVIRSAYLPTAEQVSWAERLLDFVGEDRGVFRFEGRMVDGPVYAQAERILQRASTGGTA